MLFMTEQERKQIVGDDMTEQEYEAMPVKFPVEPCCTSAVHLSCHECKNKEIAKPENNDIILPKDRYYGYRK